MSDGTNTLTFMNPENMKAIKKISVGGNSNPIDNINELEYAGGFIYANIYTTNLIVKIDPIDGNILGMIDLSLIVNEAKRMHKNSLEMNGIAYNPKTNSFFITGKLWPTIYEIKFENF